MSAVAQPVNERDRLLLERVLKQWNSVLPSLVIEPMTPDASLRRYFRVHTGLHERPSLVAVVYDSLAVPEANGGVTINSFDAFVELTRFFKARDVAVPDLLFQSASPPVILLEDLGDVLLADVLLNRVSEGVVTEPTVNYYRKAIDEIYHIQGIPADKKLFAYQRIFGSDNYIKEMHETLDFVLTPAGIAPAQRDAVVEAFHLLARDLESFPTVLVHRDFHSWNLMIDPRQKIRVIDFQDALLGLGAYDAVGLLNDRDTDSALGTEHYVELVRYFASKWRAHHPFYEEYDRTLLQRDLKVAGRFAKLVSVRGLNQYGAWIPGTLRRLGRTLERLTEGRGERAAYSRLLEIMTEIVPDVRAGADDPLRF